MRGVHPMIAEPGTFVDGTFGPDDIVRELKHLPSAPKVLPRLKRLLSDGNSSLLEIVALIRLDPAIAARVLAVANSAYYAKGVRCFNVEEAVHRVGYAQVYELVSVAVASQVLIRPLAVYDLEADDLWKSSVACALAAEMLATRSGQDRDIAYTVGLLHCLGMVAIDTWALLHRPELRLRNTGFPREAIEAERAVLGFTQADTGAALLKHWEFPRAMCEPVRWQYAPRASDGYARMACLLHCAKWLRSAACAAPGAELPPLPVEAAQQMVPLRAGELPTLVNELKHRVDEVSSLLDVEDDGTAALRNHFPAQTWA